MATPYRDLFAAPGTPGLALAGLLARLPLPMTGIGIRIKRQLSAMLPAALQLPQRVLAADRLTLLTVTLNCCEKCRTRS